MSTGALLVGIAVMTVVLAYVARPFHRRPGGEDLDKAIEAWIAEDRLDTGEVKRSRPNEAKPGGVEAPAANCCSRCGRAVAWNDRFCSGCGVGLTGETQ